MSPLANPLVAPVILLTQGESRESYVNGERREAEIVLVGTGERECGGRGGVCTEFQEKEMKKTGKSQPRRGSSRSKLE